jgi:hypothetical protein
MERMAGDHTAKYLKYVLIALGVILFVLMVFFALSYRTLRHEQLVSAREFWISSIIRNHGPLTVADTSIIRPWMTFDYVNKIFNLPPDYIKTTLAVTDPRYPQLSLGSYAKHIATTSNAFAGDVANVVRSYLLTK